MNAAKIGTANIIPTIPAISPPTSRAKIMASGCICSVRPTTCGEMTFPSRIWQSVFTMATRITILYETVAAIRSAGAAPKNGPK
ncbi:hypothetical protein D3C77_723380 [compost metagenome]